MWGVNHESCRLLAYICYTLFNCNTQTSGRGALDMNFLFFQPGRNETSHKMRKTYILPWNHILLKSLVWCVLETWYIPEHFWELTGVGILVALISIWASWFYNLTTVLQEISCTTVFILLIQATVINKIREIYGKTVKADLSLKSRETTFCLL